MATWFPSA